MILVVGANGFLGSELCKKLKQKKIIFKRIDKTLKNKEKIDINDIKVLKNFFEKNNFKIIINCACEPATAKSKEKIFETNKNGNLNLINLAIKYNIKKFIFFSTSAIFVKDYKKSVNEKTVTSPIETYGKSKVSAEIDLKNSRLKSWTIFRIPMIVSKNRIGVLSLLFDLIINHKRIPLLNKGENLLQFIHIDDLIKFILKSIKIKEKEIYNLASDEAISLKNLFLKLITSLNSKSRFIYFQDIGITSFLSFLNFLNLSPLNIYHLKMLKFSLVMNTSKITKRYRMRPKISTSQMMIDALKSYKFSNRKLKNVTEISSPIKMKILKLIYYLF